MSAYCALLAEALDLNVDLLRVASRLYDVGMAGVPSPILHKPGTLTAEERKAVEEHAPVGRALLMGSGVVLLDAAAEIAWTHHERWDGRGYPRGLAGEEIPRNGRVVAVADTFDALTTNRPYRPAGTIEDALEILRAERGRQLDPDVVDAFVARADELAAIREEFPAPLLGGPAPARNGVGAPMTLQAAAATLAISPSRLRRWADEGRIAAVRTAGGHRRFPLDAVRRLAAERGVHPNVQPIALPAEPLARLSRQLSAYGRRMAATAAAAVYREGPAGWFASGGGEAEIAEWLAALERGCALGEYGPVVQATDALMRHARSHAATLLERHAFLERFGQVAVRALVHEQADRTEIAGTRRLFTSLQQSLLQTRD